jgi:DNA mismatch repair protein MutH
MGWDFANAPEHIVLARAHELVERTPRQLHADRAVGRRGKGAFGQLVEELHFFYKPNSDPGPDSTTANLELKTTGVVRSRSAGWRTKERLVLNIIDYQLLPREEAFSASAFFVKNSSLLLIVYECVEEQDSLDHPVNLVYVLELDALPPKDRQVIEDDWKTIRHFVEEGRAHELSEGHTSYLVAARKGAGKGHARTAQVNVACPAAGLQPEGVVRITRPHRGVRPTGPSAAA